MSLSRRNAVWAAAVFVTLVVLAAAVVWIYQRTYDLSAVLELESPIFSGLSDSPPGSTGLSSGQSDSPAKIDQSDLSLASLKPWSGWERVSILLLGVDQRCDDDGPSRTDTIMVLSIDPLAKTASALSIPRDLWVEIPDYGPERINQAHYFGELDQYPGGGGVLAAETVEGLLGLEIDYYAVVNFDAFIELIDMVGGIDVDVDYSISDPEYPDRCYGFDPFTIDEGHHHLDGATALKYARTRNTFGSDVDRAGRQQQVVLALRDRVTSLGLLPSLLSKSADLWQAFRDNVRTDLSLSQVVQLALLAQDIPRDQIRRDVIGYEHVVIQTSPEGWQVLVPNRDEIRTLRYGLFPPVEIPRPSSLSHKEGMAAEAARVAVYSSVFVPGIAASTRDYLDEMDVDVVEIGNHAPTASGLTRIIDYGDNPDTVGYLADLLRVRPLNLVSEDSDAADYDILVIIGADWELPAR